MTHRRRARPWRVTVDSLSADTSFTSRSPRTVHFRAVPSNGCGPPDYLAATEKRRSLLPPPSPGGRHAIESP